MVKKTRKLKIIKNKNKNKNKNKTKKGGLPIDSQETKEENISNESKIQDYEEPANHKEIYGYEEEKEEKEIISLDSFWLIDNIEDLQRLAESDNQESILHIYKNIKKGTSKQDFRGQPRIYCQMEETYEYLDKTDKNDLTFENVSKFLKRFLMNIFYQDSYFVDNFILVLIKWGNIYKSKQPVFYEYDSDDIESDNEQNPDPDRNPDPARTIAYDSDDVDPYCIRPRKRTALQLFMVVCEILYKKNINIHQKRGHNDYAHQFLTDIMQSIYNNYETDKNYDIYFPDILYKAYLNVRKAISNEVIVNNYDDIYNQDVLDYKYQIYDIIISTEYEKNPELGLQKIKNLIESIQNKELIKKIINHETPYVRPNMWFGNRVRDHKESDFRFMPLFITALYTRYNHIDLLKYLISIGADVNKPTSHLDIAHKDGATNALRITTYSLNYVKKRADHIALTEFLLKNGADPNHYVDSWDSYLSDAVQNNDIELVDLLLKYGANPDSTNSKNVYTPMENAANEGVKTGNFEMLIKLSDAGATFRKPVFDSIFDRIKRTPAYILAESDEKELMLENLKKLKEILRNIVTNKILEPNIPKLPKDVLSEVSKMLIGGKKKKYKKKKKLYHHIIN